MNWEKEYTIAREETTYYREELAKAHAILGRVIQQLGERWDSVRLTPYFPTSNLKGKRTIKNPSGEDNKNNS